MKKRLNLEDFKLNVDVKKVENLIGVVLGDCHDDPSVIKGTNFKVVGGKIVKMPTPK